MVSPPVRENPTSFSQNPLESDHLTTKNIILYLVGGVLFPALLAYSMATAHETQVVAVVLGLLAFILALADPFIGLVVFVGLLYTRPEEIFPPLQGMRFSFVGSIVTLLALLVKQTIDRTKAVKHPVNKLILAFGAIAVISAHWLHVVGHAGHRVRLRVAHAHADHSQGAGNPLGLRREPVHQRTAVGDRA